MESPFVNVAAGLLAAALMLHAPNVKSEARSALQAKYPRPPAPVRTVAVGAWTTEVAGRSVAATGAQLVGDSDRTQFLLTVTHAVRATAVALENPYRVIIDLPDVEFRLEPVAGQRGHGLVTAYSYGLLEPRKSRIVLETAGPVHVGKVETIAGSGGRPAQVRIELVKGEPANVQAAREPPAIAPTFEFEPPQVDEAAAAPGRPNAKPVIVIDPGHGGLDPGAVGAGGLLEKNLVMAVGRHLRAILAASGHYRVVMTRSNDILVSLDERLRLSRQHHADLFVSIHADAVGVRKLAANVRGATIYTLSEQASDEEARLLAERENGADVLAGLGAAPRDDRDDVRTILIDLLRQETANLSADFRTLLIDELRTRVSLARDPQRSAAFKVLKQTHSPAVLIELGYMSNPEDQKLMKSAQWQTQVAETIATAINDFFAKRLEGMHR